MAKLPLCTRMGAITRCWMITLLFGVLLLRRMVKPSHMIQPVKPGCITWNQEKSLSMSGNMDCKRLKISELAAPPGRRMARSWSGGWPGAWCRDRPGDGYFRAHAQRQWPQHSALFFRYSHSLPPGRSVQVDAPARVHQFFRRSPGKYPPVDLAGCCGN